MDEKQRMTRFAADAAQAALMALALFMNMNVLSGNNYVNFAAVFQPFSMSVTAVACMAFFALRMARGRLPESGKRAKLVCLLLGAWQVMAASVRNTAEINQPFLTSGQMLKAAVLALGSACFFMLFYRVLEAALNGALDMRALRGGRLLRVYREHTLAFCAAVVLLCWLPHLALSYPGAFMGDTVMQIRQAMGWEAWSAMHPIGVTALMWLLVQASRLLGSGNAAMFGYVAVQSVLAAIVIGYSQQIMRRLGAPRWLRVVGLVACAGAAVYSNNITVILKDIIYVYALLLLLCELARGYLLEGEAYRRSAGYMLRMGLACFLALKARTNGVMIVLPVALVMVVKALRSRDMLGRTLALVLVPFVLSAAVDSGLGRAVYIEPTSSREVLSMPYQQTARFVTKHGDEIPQEEREIIDRVLIYDNLPRFYDPLISDPVKLNSRDDATAEDFARYFGVWAKQFARDPLCYFAATLVQNTLLFDPVADNVRLFYGTGLSEEEEQALNVHRPEILQRLEPWKERAFTLLFSMPIVPQLSSLGFHCIVLLGAAMIARRRRVRGMGLLLLPQLITMIFLPFGPCIYLQDRYGFPVIYLMPLMLACLSYGLRAQKKA